jgi:hypothetical protein
MEWGLIFNFFTTDVSPQYDSSYLRGRQSDTEILNRLTAEN